MTTITYTVPTDNSYLQSNLITMNEGDTLYINESTTAYNAYGIFRSDTSNPNPDSAIGLPNNATWTFSHSKEGYCVCSPTTGIYSVSKGQNSIGSTGSAKGGDILIVVGPPSTYKEAEAYVHDGTAWRKTDSYIREV